MKKVFFVSILSVVAILVFLRFVFPIYVFNKAVGRGLLEIDTGRIDELRSVNELLQAGRSTDNALQRLPDFLLQPENRARGVVVFRLAGYMLTMEKTGLTFHILSKEKTSKSFSLSVSKKANYKYGTGGFIDKVESFVDKGMLMKQDYDDSVIFLSRQSGDAEVVFDSIVSTGDLLEFLVNDDGSVASVTLLSKWQNIVFD